MFYDNVILSDTDVYTSKSAFSLKADYIGYEAFAVQHTEVVNGVRTVSYTDAQGNAITAAEFEEERRLLYVAMTRARDHLELLYVTGTRDNPRPPSRFLSVYGVRGFVSS